jgi:hypothetical protein
MRMRVGIGGEIGIAIAKVAGYLALLTWFGFIALSFYFDATRPVKPAYGKGGVIPHNNHGHIVYLTDHEQDQLLALQRIPIGLALVAIVAAYFHKRATGKTPN